MALNQAYNDTLKSASDVVSETVKEQAGLMKEVGPARFRCVNSTVPRCEQDVLGFFLIFLQLCRVRELLQKAVLALLQLNEKAAAAVKERDECVLARDQAVEDREQVLRHPGTVTGRWLDNYCNQMKFCPTDGRPIQPD